MNKDLLLEEAPLRVCFDLPRSLAPISHLRRSVRSFVESLGFCAQDADDLETLLGELSSNVVRHANAEKYHVSVDFLEGRFIVTVIDKGVGFSIGDSVPATLRPDTLPGRTGERIGGLGLVMVHSIADNVQIQPSVPQGTTVRAEKRMKTPVSITTMAG